MTSLNMLSRVTLRQATPEDAATLKHWDSQPHVIASDPHDDWDWDIELTRTPGWRDQLIAEAEGRAVGFIQIIDPLLEESHYWGQVSPNLRAIDIWIGKEEDLGKGYGTEMMKLAIRKCFADKAVEAILIDPLESNVRAIQFYERLGFQFVERRRFGEDDCVVMILRRTSYIELKI
jgi:aminoglycoside 6'-N-acetyltransferase